MGCLVGGNRGARCPFPLPTMVTWQGRCPTTGLLTSPFVVRSPPLCCPRSGLTILLFSRVPLTVVWFPSGVHPDAAGFCAVGIALGCVGCRVSLHIGWYIYIYIPLATSTTVLSGPDFCANCDFCVKSWVRGICMWRILWFWCFLMIQRRIRVLHVDQFGRSQDRSRPVFVPSQTNSNEKGIQGLQGFYFFYANCMHKTRRTDRTNRTEPFISLRVNTRPDRSGPVFEQTA